MLLTSAIIAIVILLLVCLKLKVDVLVFSHYIVTKGYPMPTDADITESAEYVIKRLFHLS